MNVTTQTQWIKTLPAWAYKLGAHAWIDEKFPRHIFLETTASCNLACAYCPREDLRHHMGWDTFTGLVDEAARYGDRSFSLHLFGEPLLYPRCLDAIRYIKARRQGNVVLLTTNGTLLEDSNIVICEVSMGSALEKRQKNSEPQDWGPQCDSHQLGRGP